MNDDVDDECNVAAQLDLDFFSQRLEFTAVIAKPQRQHEEELFVFGGGSGAAGGEARHDDAPMLQMYATTSALLHSMANLSAVLP